MNLQFRELKHCEFPLVKQMIVAQLRTLADEAASIMALH